MTNAERYLHFIFISGIKKKNEREKEENIKKRKEKKNAKNLKKPAFWNQFSICLKEPTTFFYLIFSLSANLYSQLFMFGVFVYMCIERTRIGYLRHKKLQWIFKCIVTFVKYFIAYLWKWTFLSYENTAFQMDSNNVGNLKVYICVCVYIYKGISMLCTIHIFELETNKPIAVNETMYQR